VKGEGRQAMAEAEVEWRSKKQVLELLAAGC
jgi:hypothetical protein